MNCIYDVEYNASGRGSLYKTGYLFVGWSTNSSEGYNSTNVISEGSILKNLTSVDGGVVTLYAIWKPIGYTVNVYENKPSDSTSFSQYIK